MAEERQETAFIVGALLGSVAGAVYGLLNAPQAGWRTRADLSGYAEEWGDRLAARLSSLSRELRLPRDDEVAYDPEQPWGTSFGGSGTSAGAAALEAGQTASVAANGGATER